MNQKLSSIEEAIKNQYKLVENVDSTLLEVLDVMRSISNIVEVANTDYKQNILEGIFGPRIDIDLKNKIVRTAYFNPIIQTICCKSDNYNHIAVVHDGILAGSPLMGT